jgi:hypothetical protein
MVENQVTHELVLRCSDACWLSAETIAPTTSDAVRPSVSRSCEPFNSKIFAPCLSAISSATPGNINVGMMDVYSDPMAYTITADSVMDRIAGPDAEGHVSVPSGPTYITR